MGLIGSLIGVLFGARFGWFGAFAGWTLGSYLEDALKKKGTESWAQKHMEQEARARMDAAHEARTSRARSSFQNEVLFLTAVGAMLAKLAKADGRIDESEIEAGERAFQRLGLTPEKRAFVIRAFRAAKQDGRTIFEYAASFTAATPARAMRELMYDILWDLACADGVLAAEERRILEMITTSLGIRASLFLEQFRRRYGTFREGASSRQRTRQEGRRSSSSSGNASSTQNTDPFVILGCTRSATNDEVRRAYRAQAKKYHPDVLRAQGLPEELIAKANEQMARINAAWDEVKRERQI